MNKSIKAQDFDKSIYDYVENGIAFPIENVQNVFNMVMLMLSDGETILKFYPSDMIEVSIKGPGTDEQFWAMFNLWFQDEWEVWEAKDIDELQPLVGSGYVWLTVDEDGPKAGLTDQGRELVESMLKEGRRLLSN